MSEDRKEDVDVEGEESDDELDFAMTKKKKKKKPQVEEAAKDSADNEANGDDGSDDDSDGDSGDGFSGKKKKKKKAGNKVSFVEGDVKKEESEDSDSEDGAGGKSVPWAGTDRDYKYDELVDRVFALLQADRPELAGGKKRYTMKPPQVYKDGTKKTVWANLVEMCETMKRTPEHVISYVLAELGTSGNVDGSHRLVVKGRFQPKHFENVIRHYILEYVSCRTCKSPETLLKKENRLTFVVCKQCGSSRTVAAVRKGFEAQIAKRRLMRNKLAAGGKAPK